MVYKFSTRNNNFIDLITKGKKLIIILNDLEEKLKSKKKSLKHEQSSKNQSISSVSQNQNEYPFNTHLSTLQSPKFSGDILQ